MKQFVTILLACLIPAIANAQVEIQGAREASPGELVALNPLNAQETRIAWNLNHPESFEQFAEENGKLFIAMPNHTISFSLLVIPNDTSQPIQNIRHTITVSGEPPPVVDPPPDIKPPPIESSEFYEAAVDSFKAVDDKPTALLLAKNYQMAVDHVADYVELNRAVDLIQDARAATFEALPEQRKLWNPALKEVGDLIGIEDPKTVPEFAAAMQTVIKALNEAGK